MNRRDFLRALGIGAVASTKVYSIVGSGLWTPSSRIEWRDVGDGIHSYPTLAEWARKIDPEGAVQHMADILNQQNEILSDLVVVTTDGTYHYAPATALPYFPEEFLDD